MARFAVLAGALIMTGCNADGDSTGKAVSRLIVGEYVNIEPVEVQVGGEIYRVFDNASIKKMVITRSMGWILVHAAGHPKSLTKPRPRSISRIPGAVPAA
jgi:hypothetical protein